MQAEEQGHRPFTEQGGRFSLNLMNNTAVFTDQHRDYYTSKYSAEMRSSALDNMPKFLPILAHPLNVFGLLSAGVHLKMKHVVKTSVE